MGRTDPDLFTATLLSNPLLDSTLRDISVLSYNLCHQGILNGLEKFMQRHAAAQFCCVSIKKSLLGGEVACTTVCRMTLSQTRDCAHQIKVLAIVSTAAVKLPLPNYAVEFRTPS